MTIRPITCAAVATLAGATVAMGQAEYDFFLVDAFNVTYSLREAYVTEINEANVACGRSTYQSSYGGFVWTEQGEKEFIPSNSPKGMNIAGLVVDNNYVLDTVTKQATFVQGVGNFSIPRLTDVNDAGIVVGHGWTGSTTSNVYQYGPLVWDAVNGTRIITDVPDARTFRRINNSNQIIGQIAPVVLDKTMAFVYDLDTGVWTNLSEGLTPNPVVGFAITSAAEISDSGSVVGELSDGTGAHGFIWKPGAGMTYLPPLKLGEAMRVTPYGVNSSDVVVGSAAISPFSNPEFAWHAFVWDAQNGMRDLNDLVELPPNFILDRAIRINDNGWIVGDGHFGPGWATSRGFVLKPKASAGCYANCDGSTSTPALNVADFGCFLQQFAAGDPSANCDGSTTAPVLNVSDFGCFLTKFAAGCP